MDGTILDKKYNIVGRIEALEAGGGGGGYVLPIATDETLGGIKVGNGLEINSETGVLSNTNPTPYTPVSYSTTEQNTGQKWIDGKDIYFKTIVYETPFTIANGEWYTSTESYTNIDIIKGEILSSTFAYYMGAIVVIENNKLVIGNQTKDQPMTNVKYVTLYYTKTTVTRSKKK